MKTSSILNVFAAFILCGILIISCGKSPDQPVDQQVGAHPIDNDRAIPYDNSDWMAKIDDDKYLSEITIPGTHDSGADLHTSGQGAASAITIAQDFRLANQLKMGVRWFDIRLLLHRGEFTVRHGDYYLQKSVDDMIKPALDFLGSHPEEVVVFMIKQEKQIETDQNFAFALYQHIQNNYALGNFYLENRVPTILEARGKIVIVRRYGPAVGNFGMRFYWDDNTSGAHYSTEGVDIYVQDHYKLVTVSYDDKNRVIKDCIGYAHAETNRQKFHLNFTSGEKDIRDLRDIASNINPVVNDYLLSNPSWHNCGVIMVNFAGGSDNGVVSSELVRTIVNQNDFSIPTVTIGSQVWMKRDLNVGHYRDGYHISEVSDPSAWSHLTTGAFCWYNNNPFTIPFASNTLYNWYAVNNSRGLCPSGFHVPSDAEWETLINYLGGASVAGGKLKATYHWASPNTGATNESGFTALPVGWRDELGHFSGLSTTGEWWSSTASSSDNAWYRYIHYDKAGIFRENRPFKYGFPVRCIKD